MILGASVAPFLAPPVVRFEQDRAGVGAVIGDDAAELDMVTGGLVGDFVLWRGDLGVSAIGVVVTGASIVVALVVGRRAARAAVA